MTVCDNSNLTLAVCPKSICWETRIGTEFYRLTVFDLLTQVLIVIFVDVIRVRCFKAEIEFSISKHTLDIVYR